MPFGRFIVSVKKNVATEAKDAVVNTLYFNVSNSPIDPTGWQNLVNDLWTLWSSQSFGIGRYIDVRAYDMADQKPRPVKAMKAATASGTALVNGVPQVALALSYYADRNLPRQRGRLFLGPWLTSTDRPSSAQQNQLITFGQGLSAIGGVNVDWSLYSPTTNEHTRISNIWVDDAWDIIRSRRLKGSSRVTATING